MWFVIEWPFQDFTKHDLFLSNIQRFVKKGCHGDNTCFANYNECFQTSLKTQIHISSAIDSSLLKFFLKYFLSKPLVHSVLRINGDEVLHVPIGFDYKPCQMRVNVMKILLQLWIFTAVFRLLGVLSYFQKFYNTG